MGLSSSFMADISLAVNVSSHTRSKSTYYNYSNPKTINYGLRTIRSMAPKLWDMIPMDLRNVSTLTIFKIMIKKWVLSFKRIDTFCKPFLGNGKR